MEFVILEREKIAQFLSSIGLKMLKKGVHPYGS